MDETMQKYYEDFLTLCMERLEIGEKVHKDVFIKTDMYLQIMEELADVCNYAFLEYMKICVLRNMKEKVVSEKNNDQD